MAQLYRTDFYSWAMEQATLARAGRLDGLDLEHVAEELEALGRSEAAALKSSLRVLLVHLLKWQYQPERRSRSWTNSIDRERDNIEDHLRDNPGLRPRLAELLRQAYALARREAARQTRLPLETFPLDCAQSLEQITAQDWLPQ
ncbi:DUF29 domain-containing protein [uncultured Gammaproteobacteria bacterium]